MGSFNTTCALSNNIIDSSTEVVMLMLTPRKHHSAMATYSWSFWSPVPILFEGIYSGYGTLDDAKLFQSKEGLSEEKLENISNLLFKDLSLVTTGSSSPEGEKKSPKNLCQLLEQRDFSFVSEDTRMSMAKIYITQREILQASMPGKEEELDEVMLKTFGFNNFGEVKEFVETNKNKTVEIPISFMMFKKDVFLKLLDNYGVGKIDEDNYATIIQNERKKVLNASTSESVREMIDMLECNRDYSGVNIPMYKLQNLIHGSKDAEAREDLIKLRKMQCIDISLLNEYLSVLGKQYQPTMYVSEDIKHYGHDEAMEIQKSLLNTDKPSPKLKKA